MLTHSTVGARTLDPPLRENVHPVSIYLWEISFKCICRLMVNKLFHELLKKNDVLFRESLGLVEGVSSYLYIEANIYNSSGIYVTQNGPWKQL